MIALTERGRTLADSVIRKHRLAERLLVDVIGLPWHKAHLEAGRWEHVISDEVETHLVALLGNPEHLPARQSHTGGRAVSSDPCTPGEPGRRRTGRTGAAESESPRRSSWIWPRSSTWANTAASRAGRPSCGPRAPDGTVTLEIDGGAVALGPGLTQQMFVAAV